jgi:hypothetical protein
MVGKDEVVSYLRDFHEKMKIYGVLFRDDRGKNFNALIELDIRPVDRIQILQSLSAEDYSEGPLIDQLYNIAPLWVFGKLVKNSLVYIKISMGAQGSGTICISFHPAEHPMNFPLKHEA